MAKLLSHPSTSFSLHCTSSPPCIPNFLSCLFGQFAKKLVFLSVALNFITSLGSITITIAQAIGKAISLETRDHHKEVAPPHTHITSAALTSFLLEGHSQMACTEGETTT